MLVRVLLIAALLGLWGPAASADLAAVPVPGGTGESHQSISCGGTAPVQPGCVGQMTLQHDFNIHIQLAFSYRGLLTIRGFTDTGSTTVLCEWVLNPGTPCKVFRDGEYVEGQIWTMVVAATGAGYWSVTAG